MAIYFIYALGVFLLFHIQPKNYPLLQETNANIKKRQNRCLFLAILVLILIFGLRDVSVGVDTKQYKIRFLQTAYMDGLDTSQEEYGFSYIGYLFHKAGLSWQVYLFTLSVFMVGVLGYFIYQYSNTPWLSIWIFMFIEPFPMYMTGLRQSLAVSLCLLALMLLLSEKPNWIKIPLFLGMVYLASTIHTSAFVFYIMILLVNIRLTRRQTVCLLLICVSVLLYADQLEGFIEKILPARYEDYELLGMNGEKYKQNPLVMIVAVMQTAFCLFFNTKIGEDGKYDKITSMLFVMSCFNVMFKMLNLSNNQIGRIVYYFANANVVLIPQSIAGIKDKSTKMFAVLAIALCALLYFLISIPGGTTEIDHYLFFWQTS